MRNYLLLFSLLLSLTQCSKSDAVNGTNSANNQTLGTSANDFLSSNKFTSLTIQLQYMPGFAPDATALNNLTNFLNSLLNKPEGISIIQTPIAASGKASLSIDDIVKIENTNRTAFNNGKNIAVYVLYADAPYTQNNVLGIAYKNTSLVIFAATINANSGGLNQTSRTKLETVVTEHEFGHLLGLTDLGTKMVTPHKDAANGSHCNNTNCLMYYASQTTMIGGLILTGPIPTLDANCRADLQANGGK